jgi:hypothetical protein
MVRLLRVQADDVFLRNCTLDVFRASGPGGQKRNKTSSAVRLTHTPTGLSATSSESRSQADNRETALRRLRLMTAIMLRLPVDDPVRIDPVRATHATFPQQVAIAMDVLEEESYVLNQAADRLGMTTGALSKFLESDEAVLSEVNRQRAARSLRPLRPG